MLIIYDTAVLSFYISFLGIIGLIGFKSNEIKKGRNQSIKRLTDFVDSYLLKLYSLIKTAISYLNKDSFVASVQWIAYHILSWARDLYIWLYRKARSHPPSKRVVDMVRGRGVVDKKGGISFYLRRIAQSDEDVAK